NIMLQMKGSKMKINSIQWPVTFFATSFGAGIFFLPQTVGPKVHRNSRNNNNTDFIIFGIFIRAIYIL
ncbi:hypothetical protein LVK53_28310, partial [Escherichia coli]|nr:hypothetical protein [Escherichia coli]